MARNGKQGRRPDARASAANARRLGAQQNRPMSSGAQRRYSRRRTPTSRRTGWLAVGGVVIVVVVLIVVNLATKSNNNGSSGIASGQDPVLASASIVSTVASVPASTFDSVGVAGQPAAFTVTKNQKSLTSGGKPEFVYYGAEYCPYCALMRWSLVAALSRFGTFKDLKQTNSSSTDGNIPTFSFLGSTYTSPYLTFSPYEYLDRNQNPLQSVPNSVNSLYAKYDGNGSGQASTPFNQSGGAGIPFLDIDNKYVSSGDPALLGELFSGPNNDGHGVLVNGGPGTTVIAQSIADPSTADAKAISAGLFIVEANYISAAICDVDGGQPAAVCTSSGVKAAAKVLAAEKPVS